MPRARPRLPAVRPILVTLALVSLGLALVFACRPEKLVVQGGENKPPSAQIGGPSAAKEGSLVAFEAGQSSDPDDDSLFYAWDLGDGARLTGPVASHAYRDNGSYGVTLVVSDSRGLADTAGTTVTIANAPPQITALTTPTAPHPVNVPALTHVLFDDPGSGDSLTVTLAWGDGATSSATNGNATHRYAAAGRYVITATVRDDDGESVTRTATTAVVVYDGYEVIDLGTLGGGIAVPLAINDSSQVVGYSTTASGNRHAFIWEKGAMRDLTPGGPASEAHLIANSGAITGVSNIDHTSYVRHLVVWKNGVMSALGQVVGPSDGFVTPVTMTGTGDVVARGGGNRPASAFWQNGVKRPIGDGPTEARAMNNLRHIVGATGLTETPGVEHPQAFVWKDGAMQLLQPLVSFACPYHADHICSSAIAVDNNNSGDVIGTSLDSLRRPHAVLWRQGSIRDLGFERAARINEAGEIAGEGGGNGFFWYQGTTTPLGSLGGGETVIADLNNQSTLIGTSLTAQGMPHVFVWKRGQVALKDLGVGGIAGDAAFAVAMNSRGDLVGYACRADANNRCDRWETPLRAILWRVKP